jgi:putative SOS response-associated peptidase YedK
MCGRAALSAPPEDLREVFGLDEVPDLPARYNIAPTQPIAILRADPENPGRRITLVRWGLVPPGADLKVGPRMINARVETAPSRAPFREALRHRRCLVLVDGFYEWKTEGKKKRPFFVQTPDKKPFALAGLWARWATKDGEVIDSCAILTRPARPPVSELHDRMPVIVPREAYEAWLDLSIVEPAQLGAVLAPPAGTPLVMYEVTTHVNRVDNDDAACLEPASAVGEKQQTLLS